MEAEFFSEMLDIYFQEYIVEWQIYCYMYGVITDGLWVGNSIY
jgi:hypothetical protein